MDKRKYLEEIIPTIEQNGGMCPKYIQQKRIENLKSTIKKNIESNDFLDLNIINEYNMLCFIKF